MLPVPVLLTPRFEAKRFNPLQPRWPSGAIIGGISVGGRWRPAARSFAAAARPRGGGSSSSGDRAASARRWLESYRERQEKLRQLAARTDYHRIALGGGNIAHVERRVFPSSSPEAAAARRSARSIEEWTAGSESIVVKEYGPTPAGVREAEREELGALVLDALDTGVPVAVSGDRPGTVYMEYVEGTHWRFLPWRQEGWAAEPVGVRLGIADLLTAEGDRHPLNIMRTPDGRTVPIDQGGSFGVGPEVGIDEVLRRQRYEEFPGLRGNASPFALYLTEVNREGRWGEVIAGAGIDLDEVEARLRLLEPEFERRGRQDWYASMMARLAEIRARAGQDRPAGGPPPGAVRRADLARALGVQPEQLAAWSREPGFPGPVAEVDGVFYYDPEQIRAWLALEPGHPGRVALKAPGRQEDLAKTVSDAAQILGINRELLRQWIVQFDDFPEPVGTDRGVPLYRPADIRAWHARHQIGGDGATAR
jgi:hypothetical protein